MCYARDCKCRNFNSMRPERIAHLRSSIERYVNADQREVAEAYRNSLATLTGYGRTRGPVPVRIPVAHGPATGATC